jgi:hypothetical protein
MSISVSYISQHTITETVEGVNVGSDATYNVTGLNETTTLTSSSTPPVTKYSSFRKTLSAGSGTIDLTSLPDYNGTAAAVTLTGLKPQLIIFRNLSTNANSIKVVAGASNGYDGFGSDFAITLQPGDSWRFRGNDNSGVTDIASGKKTFDLTGTSSQVLEVQIVAG